MDKDIVYPVIVLGKSGVWTASDAEQLTTTQRALLGTGLYSDRLLIDSGSYARHLKEAREISASDGILNRAKMAWNPSVLIRVELIFDSAPYAISIDELKGLLLKSLAGRPAKLAEWDPGIINLDQLNEGLKSSQTFDEVFRLVRECRTIRPELR